MCYSIVYYSNGAQRHEQFLHSKLDYCNSLYHNLPNHQLNRLQQTRTLLLVLLLRLLNPHIYYYYSQISPLA